MKTLEEIKSECASCQKCPLCESRTNSVFGVGVPNAEIMLIGEAPGENEDLTGVPFVGRAGKLLDKVLEEAGFSREKNIFIANMLKCRPPKNRDPLPSEVDLCVEYLKKQIEAINPKVIVLVGRISAMYFLGKDFKMTRQHGNAYYQEGRLWYPIFHPAAILRNMNQLPLMQEDIMKLRKMVDEIK
ncbi:MAG: uracil-DNA glycosylase [Oscillospiraceae bacterium]|nr:uracil-DNA glycosylase [Oscillospiraceae bacterium]